MTRRAPVDTLFFAEIPWQVSPDATETNIPDEQLTLVEVVPL